MSKVVIITGASSGIGLTTAKFLSSKGFKVYGISRRNTADEDFVNYVGDVNDTENIKNIFEQIYKIEGSIDVVINNAGFGIAGAVEYASNENIEQIFNTNLIALVKLSSLAIKYLKLSKGKLINISSVAGILPIPFQACYSASKAGVLNFSLALDSEISRFGVKTTCILPGDTKTGFTKARVIENKEEGYDGHIKKSISKMENDEQKGLEPLIISKTILKVLKKKNPPLKITVGASYKFFVFLNRIMPTRLVNFLLKKIYG